MILFVSILRQLINIYTFILLIYCILSWFPRGGGGFIDQLYGFLGSFCEPFLGLFRKVIPPIGGGGGVAIDISPIVAILVLQLVMVLITRILL